MNELIENIVKLYIDDDYEYPCPESNNITRYNRGVQDALKVASEYVKKYKLK